MRRRSFRHLGQEWAGFELSYDADTKSYKVRVNTPATVFDWVLAISYLQILSRRLGNDIKGEDGRRKLSSAIRRLQDAPIHIDDGASLSATELRARVRRLKSEVGDLGLVLVDYLQLMQLPAGKNDNRAALVGEISRALKLLAKEMNVPVIALSQLSRQVETRPNKRPVMADIRESGAIEQDADVILFVYRDEVYHNESPDKGIAEIIIGKQRNGPIGAVKLQFQGQCLRFGDLAHGYDDGAG